MIGTPLILTAKNGMPTQMATYGVETNNVQFDHSWLHKIVKMRRKEEKKGKQAAMKDYIEHHLDDNSCTTPCGPPKNHGSSSVRRILQNYTTTTAAVVVAIGLCAFELHHFYSVQAILKLGQGITECRSYWLDLALTPGVFSLYVAEIVSGSEVIAWIAFFAAMLLFYGTGGLTIDIVRRAANRKRG
jgi:hypothetical protein